MSLSKKEQIILKETRLRNLKRKHARIINHPDLSETAITLQKEINKLTEEINELTMK